MNYKIGIIKRNNYFFSNSFLLIFLFIISFFFSYCYYTSAHTHLVTKLKNGNFMVFTCDGIYTLDPYFNLYNITTELSCSNYMENIAHFSEEDGEYFIYICPNHLMEIILYLIVILFLIIKIIINIQLFPILILQQIFIIF